MEHRDIPDNELHEPKGAVNALQGTFYKSNGQGSGSWGKLTDDNVEGLGAGSPAGRRIVTDGSGGFFAEVIPAAAFGTMNLTNNTTALAVTEAGDSSLRDPVDFQEFNVALDFDSVEGMVSGSNYLEVIHPGLYLVNYWANLQASVNSTRIAVGFVKNDSEFVPRAVHSVLTPADSVHSHSANGIHQFEGGDQIKLYVASDKNANLTVTDMTFQLVYLRGLV